jgi:hypothetical protein
LLFIELLSSLVLPVSTVSDSITSIMHIAPALVAGCLALEASAFLVPLEVSEAAQQAKSELASLLANTGRTFDLDCPGCPYFGVEDTEHPDEDVENKIVSTCSPQEAR